MNTNFIIKSTIEYLESNSFLDSNCCLSNNQKILLDIEQKYKHSHTKELLNNCLKEINIQNRRYLGNKFKLLTFIEKVIKENNIQYDSFLDLFAGTGVVGDYFNNEHTQVISNDLLKSNYYSFLSWLSDEEYNKNKITSIISNFNNIETVKENYFSKNFGNTFFTNENAKKIGYIRDEIKTLYKNEDINQKEHAILLTSLLYATDKVANTCGHYDAFRKKLDMNNKLELGLLSINDDKNKNNLIFNEDANKLVKKISADLVYIDPPYNSRQYGDAYHLLENLVHWKKQPTTGVARKIKDRSKSKSSYCTVSAPHVFKDLIDNLDCKYILVSYNNMENKGASRSQAKISRKEIEYILRSKGNLKIFEEDYSFFNTGKTNITNHKELLFLCKVDQTNNKTSIKTTKKSKITNVKSPLNYTGGKYKLLPQIQKLIPKDINTLYDIFSGGSNVGSNIKAKKVISIDKNLKVINLMNYFKDNTFESIVEILYKFINQYKLSNTTLNSYAYYDSDSSKGVGRYNKDQYTNLRTYFNNLKYTNKNYNAILFLLIVYSFNNQIRFNKENNFNNPVGKRDFNNSLKNKLNLFMERIQSINITFQCNDFRDIDITDIATNDFIYLDPPYYITTATYNENNGWTKQDELDLLIFLDKINDKGVKFALSNVIRHKGKTNTILESWAIKNKFNINKIDHNYNNSNYQSQKTDLITEEVLITNY